MKQPLTMKKLTATALLATLLGTGLSLSTVPAVADDDIGADEAVQLLQAGTIKPLETLKQAALQKHPGATVHESELERVYGRYVYKLELRDANGDEWDVDVDATTGEILEDKRDR